MVMYLGYCATSLVPLNQAEQMVEKIRFLLGQSDFSRLEKDQFQKSVGSVSGMRNSANVVRLKLLLIGRVVVSLFGLEMVLWAFDIIICIFVSSLSVLPKDIDLFS